MHRDHGLHEELVHILEAIDAGLSARHVPVARRPFEAAVEFVRDFVIEYDDGETRHKPENSAHFVLEPWFRGVYRPVVDWYRDRYGEVVDDHGGRTIDGVVLAHGTPFRIKVPTAIISPGRPGKTIWVQYPDAVLDGENVADWLINPPGMDPAELSAVRTSITEVATGLRSVWTKLLTSGGDDEERLNLQAGVLAHLEDAVDRILSYRRGDLQRACHEVQMACECAFKALLKQKTGGPINETHDLFVLYDRAQPYGLSLDRDLLKRLPRWQEMTKLRYAVRPSLIAECFDYYRTALKVTTAAIAAMDRVVEMGNARLEIARAPWTLDEPVGRLSTVD